MITTETFTLPRAEYDALVARLEDLEDIAAAASARTGITLPSAFADRIMEGEHAVRVWREYREISLTELAERSGISKGYVSEIETGKKPGSVEAYKALAQTLNTSVDWLLS
ncbi:XRE family transcriptional regulator [uncultured Gammaproteobacteria bacterium]